jgi:hypothetical protein
MHPWHINLEEIKERYQSQYQMKAVTINISHIQPKIDYLFKVNATFLPSFGDDPPQLIKEHSCSTDVIVSSGDRQ